MKLSKKVLAAFSMAAALAMAVSFTSCGEEDDDDEKGAIKGSNNNYTLLFDNSESTDTYRAYHTTTGNHAGAVVQITLNKDGTDGSGAAMGYIWDLSSTDASASAEEVARAISEKPRTFCIVAFANHDGNFMPYVSRYENVYDIQAENFGVTDGVTVNGKVEKATETDYLGWASSSKNSHDKTLTADTTTGNYVMTANVYEDTNDNETTGGYVVDIYDGAVTKAQLDGENLPEFLLSVTIPAKDLGYDTAKKVTKKQGAVYANVYKKSKASGTWKYDKTYSADEVVEE